MNNTLTRADNKKKLNLAVVQLTSNDQFKDNLVLVEDAIKEACSKDSSLDLICFPECSLFITIDPKGPKFSFDLNSKVFESLCELAKKYLVHINLGSIPVKKKQDIYNTTIWITSSGKLIDVYDKLHLFDSSLDSQSATRESDCYSYGKSVARGTLGAWELGFSICYDIRFPELFCQFRKQSIDILFVPAAFMLKTGGLHWEVLLRARAIELQCFVVAAGQYGVHTSSSNPDKTRKSYGGSVIIDPWGRVIDLAPIFNAGFQDKLLIKKSQKIKTTILYSSLTKDIIVDVRKQLPVLEHIRPNAHYANMQSIDFGK